MPKRRIVPDKLQPVDPDSNTLSYAERRMKEIGFNPETDYGYCQLHDDQVTGMKTPLYWADAHGNLCIAVLSPEREIPTYDESDSMAHKKLRPIHMIRLSNPNESGKFTAPIKGMGVWPKIPIQICDKYMTGTKITRLVITEGYIKADVAARQGIDIIGLPGITVWKGREDKELFVWIRQVIEKCQVTELLFLTDADTLKVTWDEDKDLSTRPYSFYTAVKLFKRLCHELKLDLWWGHINTNCPHKGIDDLLLNVDTDIRKVKNELKSVQQKGIYITKYDLSGYSLERIKSDIFYLSTAEDFYKHYATEILQRPFVFRRFQYQRDEDTGTLKVLRNGDAQRFLKVGRQLYIKGPKPVGESTMENVLIPFSKEDMYLEFRGGRSMKDARAYAEYVYYDVPFYHGAINMPSNTNYIPFKIYQDAEGNQLRYINLYRQPTWIPRKGGCENSINFVRHIWGTAKIEHEGNTYERWELGMDWIKSLWCEPTVSLPILCLVSPENKTGKTTFMDWMRLIFQQNAREINADSLTGQFTAYFAHCILLLVDEALLEKQQGIERLKNLSTQKRTKLEGKHTNAEEIESYFHFILGTNNRDYFLTVTDKDQRYWVLDVPVLKEEVVNMLKVLESEIPSFIHYIQEWTYRSENVTRGRFAKELIETDALHHLRRESRWKIEKDIEERIIEHMTAIEEGVLQLGYQDILDMMPKNQKPYSMGEVRTTLSNRWGMQSTKFSTQYTTYSYVMNPTGIDITEHQKKSRNYTFFATRFFSFREISSWLPDWKMFQMEQRALNTPGTKLLMERHVAWEDLQHLWFIKRFHNIFVVKGGNHSLWDDMRNVYTDQAGNFTNFCQFYLWAVKEYEIDKELIDNADGLITNKVEILKIIEKYAESPI